MIAKARYAYSVQIISGAFWVSLSGVFYIYAGYPLLIEALSCMFPRKVAKKPNTLSASIIISIYNDAAKIASKMDNILSCDHQDRIKQILIGSDGRHDFPEKMISRINDPRVQLITFPERRGKPSVLNDLVKEATGDIVIMMDVRQRLDQRAITSLMDNFSDPHVGVVSGELVFDRSSGESSAAGSIDAYWRYEKWIRDRESRFHSVPGATGALYAIRRNLITPIPPEAALDDVLIPMHAIAKGYRCIFEHDAVIHDLPAQDVQRESIRKRRTLAGCAQLIKLEPLWCLPGGHPIWWQYVSHKISRLFSPFLLGTAWVTSWMLSAQTIYLLAAITQTLFYLFGVLGIVQKKSNRPTGRLLSLCSMFLIMQITLVKAWSDSLTLASLSRWEKA